MPAQYYLFYLLIPAVFYMYWKQRKALGQHLTDTGHQRFGAVAAKMGLTPTEGDPSYHLVHGETESHQAASSMQSMNPLPHVVFETDLAATGSPYGRPVTFRFVHKREATAKLPVVGRTITDTHGCFVAVPAASNVRFEVTQRNPSEYLGIERSHPDLPEVSFGDVFLDGAFVLHSEDPALAGVIAPAMAAFSGRYCHLVGEPGSIRFIAERALITTFADAPDVLLHGLESVACALEKKATPAPRAA